MNCAKTCFALIIAVTIAAAALRLPRLEQRPMHGDEAVHAVKFGRLLEEGFYEYDPYEYHGPTLNYLTLLPAWIGGQSRLAEVDEFTLRIVPVFFGVVLVLLLVLVVDGLGKNAAIAAAVFTAISPAFVFYSRYYIQEILLVCFTFGIIACGYRYVRSRKVAWLLSAGMFAGLCHATKETCIIAFGSMGLALLVTLLIKHRAGHSALSVFRTVKWRHYVWAVGVALVVSVLFHSSFLTHPGGIVDSVRTYATYFDRAGENELHIHPWYYYLRILLYTRYAGAPVWSEALIVVLAVIGFVVAMTKRGVAGADYGLLRFVGFYTLIMVVVYSGVSYKTPWCLLSFLHGMILLAGVGVVAIVRATRGVLLRLIVVLFLVLFSLQLGWQALQSSYKYYTDTRNPYVYAHPVEDVLTVAERVEEIAEAQPEGYRMHIQVICPGHDHWPLPWYLRNFDKGTIDWWDEVEEDVAAAPVIIASPSVEPALVGKLARQSLSYVPLFNLYKELRPQVEIRGYVAKEVWDKYQQRRVELLLSQSRGGK